MTEDEARSVAEAIARSNASWNPQASILTEDEWHVETDVHATPSRMPTEVATRRHQVKAIAERVLERPVGANEFVERRIPEEKGYPHPARL